jgi:glycosyltransferase involved in cell wall biosynthesis
MMPRHRAEGGPPLPDRDRRPGAGGARRPPRARQLLDPVGFANSGRRPHEQLPQALAAADALVLPSVAEAFGLVLVEAMDCGLPVIASRAHGRAAIVAHGSTGWLIPPDDEGALVHALLTAANGHRERRARGRRAQTASRRYDWAEIAPRFASLYEELLASSPRQQVARGRRA